MIKKILVSGLISLSVATVAVAQEQLQNEMNALSATMYNVERGFLANDKKLLDESLVKFKGEVKDFLGDEKYIKSLLPEDAKHKSSIAINSAKMIGKSIEKIQKTLKDSSLSAINRQMRSQKEFENIQTQCFRCHNLVRDWQ
jgi:hypothetical protein